MAIADNFCNAPFCGAFVNIEGHVLTCAAMCVAQHPIGNLNDNTFDEIINSDAYRDIVESFNSGSSPSMCETCISESRNNYNGLRNYYNRVDRDPSGKFVLKALWLSLSNECKFSCRMCVSHASTGRYKLLKKIDFVDTTNREEDGFLSPYTESNNVFDMIESRVMELERVNFNGGDPTMNRHFIRCLELLTRNPSIMLVLHISGATMSTNRMKKIGDLLSKFTNVILEFSVDGVGELNDYIRNGSDFESVMRSFYAWRNSVPHAACNIHPAISNMNVKYVGDIAYYFMTEHPTLVNTFINCKVEFPRFAQPSNMPLEQREESKRYLIDSMRKIVKLPNSEAKTSALLLCRTALYAIDVNNFDETLYKEFLEIERRTNEVISGKRKKCKKS